MRVYFYSLFIFALWAGQVFAAIPCKEDAAKFCAGVKPGEGRIVRCLEAHEAKLSASCKKERQKVKESLAAARSACDGDVQQFCSDVKPGEGRIKRCLENNEITLSNACKVSMGLHKATKRR